MASIDMSALEVPDKPNQPGPTFKFPKRSFGRKVVVQRSFQHSWFGRWPFLHYKENNDTVFCLICLKMFKEKKNRTCSKADSAFVSSLILLFTYFFVCLARYNIIL